MDKLIKINLCSFDKNLLKYYLKYLLNYCNTKKYKVTHFVTKKEKIVILRSPHVHKKSREHFEIQKHKCFVEIVLVDSHIFLKSLFAFKPVGLQLRLVTKNLVGGQIEKSKQK